MNLYGNKPQEQALQKLIHDTNSALSDMKYRIEQLDKYIKEQKPTTSHPYILLEYLKSGRQNIIKSIDCYYEKFSKDFNEQ